MLLALRSLGGITIPCIHRTLQPSSRHQSGLTNMLADTSSPAVQVKSITPAGHIELADGMLLSGACIFLGGKIFLWNVPSKLWDGWGKEQFEIFDVVVPKPGI